MMDYWEQLSRDDRRLGGEIVFKGTRVSLRTVLASLAEGDTFEQIIAAFPSLTIEHVKTAVAYAANSALEDQPIPSVPRVS
ncbi:MAG TPA: DUF433 domain-containing protein [Fimbriimonadaceae bacterium]|jgi:uncharacterized protein (DUF433 family)